MGSYGQPYVLRGYNSAYDVPEHLRYNEKQLTSAIKNATTAERLQQLAEVHADTINQIHIAAILTKLANISKKAPQQPAAVPASASACASEYPLRSATSRDKLLQQLQQQLLRQGCCGHGPRGLANIVWALAKLQCNPDPALLQLLVRNFYLQLPAAVPQDVANVLWGVAQLTHDYGTSWTSANNSTSSSSSEPLESSAALNSDVTAAGSGAGTATAATDHDDDQTALAAAAAVDAADGGGDSGSDVAAAAVPCLSSGNHSTTPAAANHHQLQQQQEDHCADQTSKPQQQQENEVHTHDQPQQLHSDSSTPSTHPNSSSSSSSGSRQPLLTLVQVHHLLQQLCKQLHVTAAQTISNVCWALTVLQQCNGWCMCCCLDQVRQIVAAFANKLREAVPGHVQRVVRCMVQLANACHNHAGVAWLDWQPPLLVRMLRRFIVQQQGLKQYHVACVMRDISQVGSE
eukprot:GHUV01005229.1.p1 GENE.GHUV01005229.1~~GHUV01005229.1.p1  ORF type:complete len:460 (+),score=166.93 GHUV01005229.1:319-1698(+)